jgi:hypothetical protein
VSVFKKNEHAVMDLQVVLQRLAYLAGQKDAEKQLADFFWVTAWCHDSVKTDEPTKSAPPLSPGAMGAKLDASKFTDGADAAVLKEKYQRTFERVLGREKRMNFMDMPWVSKGEWAAFCYEALPLCASLETLDLCNNRRLAVDVAELVARLPPTIRKLDLENTRCFGDVTEADWERLPALEFVNLLLTRVDSNDSNLMRKSGCKASQINVRERFKFS